jgi:SAM-dependent methyltransferase
MTSVDSPAQAGAATFRCPACRATWPRLLADDACPGCGRIYSTAAGIPVLLGDRDEVERAIAAAAEGERAAWYSDEQAVQWTGPYRHHLRKRIAYVEDALERFSATPVAERIGVDAGCGDGEHLGWLGRHVGRLYGSDYNALRLARAAARGTATIFLADLTGYPVADDTFDVVFCNHVLEHVPEVDRALAELRRTTAPGGVAIIGVPNEGAAFWRLAYRLQPSSRSSTDHVHFFTAETIGARCRTAGFEVLETTPIGWGLPHWTLDARVRGRKAVDDLFERIGRRLLPSQATSLYLVLRPT